MAGIVDKKYRGRKDPDWLRIWIDGQTHDEQKVVDYGKLINLAEINQLKAETVAKFKADDPKRNGVLGRASMTIRNMLQTVAIKEGKLIGIDDDGDKAEFPCDATWLAAAKARATELAAASKQRQAEAAAKAPAPAAEAPVIATDSVVGEATAA